MLKGISMYSIYLLTCTIALIFVGCHGYSESMSCSTVNGKTVCERQISQGNVAGAFSGSSFGRNGAFQDVSAMTGNSRTGHSSSSRTSLDPFRAPSFYPSQFVNQFHYPGGIQTPNQFFGTGASDATSYNYPADNNGISRSGFSGTSNNNGFPGPAFGGFAAVGAGNTYGGGLTHGNPGRFDPNKVFQSLGMGGPGFPFNMFGRKR